LPSALIVALLAARTADECAGFLTPGAFESFHRELGLSYSGASFVLVVAAPGAILVNVFTVLGDHRSRRAIGASGAIGYAAALIAFGTAQSMPVLAIASFALGMSATALVHGTELALVDLAEVGACLEILHRDAEFSSELPESLDGGTARPGLDPRDVGVRHAGARELAL